MTNLLRSTPVRTVTATVLVVAASLLLPFLVHLLPAWNGTPIGAVFLPIFYAPFLAAVFLGPVASLSAAALTPVLNHALTGMPPMSLALVLTVELLLFVTFVLLARRRWRGTPLLAPLAYLMTRLLTLVLLTLLPFTAGESWTALVASLETALPGIGMLLLINLVVTSMRQNRRNE